MAPNLWPRQTEQAAIPTVASVPVTASITRPPIALTTIFDPPASCLATITYDGTTLWQNGVSQVGDAACYPAAISDIIYSYYTPGICPQQWTSAGSYPHSSGFDAMCCPSNYILFTTSAEVLFANYCYSLTTTPLTNVVSVPSLTNGPIPNNAPLLTLAPSDVSSTTVYVDVIQVQWQSTDQEIIALLNRETASPTINTTFSTTISTTIATTVSITASPTTKITTSTSPSSPSTTHPITSQNPLTAIPPTTPTTPHAFLPPSISSTSPSTPSPLLPKPQPQKPPSASQSPPS